MGNLARHLAAAPNEELQLCLRCDRILMHNPKFLGKAHWFTMGANVIANDSCAWQEGDEQEAAYDDCVVEVN